MAPPSANPTTGKTHVAEKVKFHEGSLKPYSHEELGTADDVRLMKNDSSIERISDLETADLL